MPDPERKVAARVAGFAAAARVPPAWSGGLGGLVGLAAGYLAGRSGLPPLVAAAIVLLVWLLPRAVAVATGGRPSVRGDDDGALTPRPAMALPSDAPAPAPPPPMAPALTPPPVRAARLEADSREKAELVGRLAGAVAHDVNNTLTVVLANAEFLAEEATLPEQREAAAQIGEAARHAAALTQQLVVVSKKGLAQPRPVDLGAALMASSTALRRLLPASIALSVDAPGAAWTCIDPTQLHQLVLNLAMNARDAMPEGGALRLSARSAGGEVTLGVTDTGAGMDQATQAAAFQPFFTTKAPGKGTGLGLANVQAIVGGLGGRVALASALGRGTTFEIVLPACEPGPVAAPRGATPEKGSGRVLVVDGDVRIRALASTALLAAGYHVLDAPDGPTGLRLAARHRPDLLVTDARIPGLPLGMLLEGYWSARPGGRVLVTTAISDDERIREQVLSGALALLPKPFSRAELQAAAAAALAPPTPRPA
jgi:two-component system cell cycle sensor histidine kinase/response regulator CckA